MEDVREGGCLCGAIAYRIAGPLVDAGYCHCRLCQRAAGSPAVAWLTVANGDFGYTRGTPALYYSSADYQREFCASCGSPLAFRRRGDARTVDVTIATLADPAAVVPEYHIWRASRLHWFEVDDALPRYDDGGPDRAND